jgi:hypothetical protein
MLTESEDCQNVDVLMFQMDIRRAVYNFGIGNNARPNFCCKTLRIS